MEYPCWYSSTDLSAQAAPDNTTTELSPKREWEPLTFAFYSPLGKIIQRQGPQLLICKVNWTQDTQCFRNLDKVGQASKGWDWELDNLKSRYLSPKCHQNTGIQHRANVNSLKSWKVFSVRVRVHLIEISFHHTAFLLWIQHYNEWLLMPRAWWSCSLWLEKLHPMIVNDLVSLLGTVAHLVLPLLVI